VRIASSWIFSLVLGAAQTAQAGSFQTVYSFSGGTDGKGPYGKLVMDHGLLYGTTISGGTSQRGNIFSFDPATGTLTNLYSFTDGADGGNPQAGMELDAKGNLYGVTPRGGLTAHCNLGCGTIFKFNIASGTLTTLYSFTGLADGSTPIAPLTLYKNTLYGLANDAGTGANCGSSGCGTIFKIDTGGKVFTVLRELVVADGISGDGRMAPGPSGLLYGTASTGGPNGSGVVFGINPSTGAYSLLHGFDYHVDGAYSDADVLVHGSAIYGTTHVGGPTSANDGTVFKLDAGTLALTTLYSFQGTTDGLFPTAGVVLGKHGTLLGQTAQGGQSGAGTLFDLNAKTLALKTIEDFDGSDGQGPSGRMLADGKGGFYGVTSGGGRGAGTIYRVVP
jgi:uncharacterized repeat protein (TIGR03803 family)